MDIKLKPCPFCGCEAEVMHLATRDGEEVGACAFCRECGASSRSYYTDVCGDEERAIAEAATAWNRREG